MCPTVWNYSNVGVRTEESRTAVEEDNFDNILTANVVARSGIVSVNESNEAEES